MFRLSDFLYPFYIEENEFHLPKSTSVNLAQGFLLNENCTFKVSFTSLSYSALESGDLFTHYLLSVPVYQCSLLLNKQSMVI